MKTLASLILCGLAVTVGMSACDDDDGTTEPDLEQYVATMLGSNEAAPNNTSTATGTTILTINADNTVSWTMDLNGIKNMTASHIHAPAGPGVNAGVVANLFIPTATVTATLSGRVASGTFGPANVNLAAISYADLLTAIRTGNAYVNVHTSDGVLPSNTGMGDFPGGEIRGQTLPMP
jgi:hypothetical protein